jgi:tetratricopeptide (TPR) repeat protein
MHELLREATSVPLHLSVDPSWNLVTLIAFGRTDDGLPREQYVPLAEDDRVAFVLDAPGRGPVIGVRVAEAAEVDVAALESEELWAGPRFHVPALGLPRATAGELLLAVRARYGREQATADAAHFHMAIDAAADERPTPTGFTVVDYFRFALEAGDMKAMYGLGYSLVEAGRLQEGYDALRRYTELTPHNAWAWCWLGRACAELGATSEARAAYERAMALEEQGSFETDASRYLEELEA